MMKARLLVLLSLILATASAAFAQEAVQLIQPGGRSDVANRN